MIDAFSEALIRLSDVPGLVPGRQGKPVHIATVHRWASEGLRGVTLETIAAGGAVCTSRSALQRFFEAVSAARRTRPTSPTTDPTSEPSQARQAAQEAAERKLNEALRPRGQRQAIGA
jgi:hypothetical protein